MIEMMTIRMMKKVVKKMKRKTMLKLKRIMKILTFNSLVYCTIDYSPKWASTRTTGAHFIG